MTIHGKNFLAGSKVEFGSARAANVTRRNETTLTATAPKHAASTVDVRVITTAGTSAKAKAPLLHRLGAAEDHLAEPGERHTRCETHDHRGTTLHRVTKVVFGSTKAAKVTTLSATNPPGHYPDPRRGKGWGARDNRLRDVRADHLHLPSRSPDALDRHPAARRGA